VSRDPWLVSTKGAVKLAGRLAHDELVLYLSKFGRIFVAVDKPEDF
jgi:hypothetical protein